MSAFENSSISLEKEKPKEKSKAEKLKQAALAAVALYALPPSDAPQPRRDSFDQRAVASAQLEKDGITKAQKETYTPGISEVVEHAVEPFEYSMRLDGTDDFIRILDDTQENLLLSREEKAKKKRDHLLGIYRSPYRIPGLERMDEESVREVIEARYDAWRLYLGLPQENGTFGISEYKPEQSTEDKYYYKLNHFLERKTKRHISTKSAIHDLLMRAENKNINIDSFVGVMGQFTLTKGQDEKGHYISYYDRWDLEGSVEGEQGIIGKPFEIYDRIYYDPKILE